MHDFPCAGSNFKLVQNLFTLRCNFPHVYSEHLFEIFALRLRYHFVEKMLPSWLTWRGLHRTAMLWEGFLRHRTMQVPHQQLSSVHTKRSTSHEFVKCGLIVLGFAELAIAADCQRPTSRTKLVAAMIFEKLRAHETGGFEERNRYGRHAAAACHST